MKLIYPYLDLVIKSGMSFHYIFYLVLDQQLKYFFGLDYMVQAALAKTLIARQSPTATPTSAAQESDSGSIFLLRRQERPRDL